MRMDVTVSAASMENTTDTMGDDDDDSSNMGDDDDDGDTSSAHLTNLVQYLMAGVGALTIMVSM